MASYLREQVHDVRRRSTSGHYADSGYALCSDPTRASFAKNRQRLLDADVARELLLEIVEQARKQRSLSGEHFSVGGMLLVAWASVKSFRPTVPRPLHHPLSHALTPFQHPASQNRRMADTRNEIASR